MMLNPMGQMMSEEEGECRSRVSSQQTHQRGLPSKKGLHLPGSLAGLPSDVSLDLTEIPT